MQIEMTVKGLIIDPITNMPIVILREKEGQRVLVDARSRRRDWELSGRTSGNTIVNFEGPPEWIGQIVTVRITGANPNSLRGDASLGASCKSR